MFSHFLRKIGFSPAAGVIQRRRAGDWLWELSEAGQAFFPPDRRELHEIPQAEVGHLVKENLQRTILRVELPQGVVFVKRCRINTPRSWAREVLRPAKARLEFENALRLRDMAIATVEPLAWGRREGSLFPGESWLITREAPGQGTFGEYLEQFFETSSKLTQPRKRQQLALAFAQFLAKLHDAGVTHPDPHPGNFWLDWPVDQLPRFVLMDLHALHFGPPLSNADALANLTLINRWFQVRALRSDRLRFLKCYSESRQSWPDGPAQIQLWAQGIEQETERSNCRFWAARRSRYLTKNRNSYPVGQGAYRGFAATELPQELLKELLANPDASFAQAGPGLLKDSRTSSVVVLERDTPTGPQRLLWKRFNAKSWIHRLKNLFRPSPALRSWLAGNSVRDRGLPTAEPLLFLEQRRFGIPGPGYLLMEWVPQAEELPRAVENLQGHPRSREIFATWAERLGRMLRLMHDRQVSHRDLKGANILWKGSHPETAEPVLIDLVGVELSRPISDAHRQRDLARLAVTFLTSPDVTHSHRLLFLQSYLRRFPAHSTDWKSWWQAIRLAVEQKVLRNQRMGRPLS